MKGMGEKAKRIIKRFGTAGLLFLFLKGMVLIFFGGTITRFIIELIHKV
ncbi:hypothetical protein ACE1ET_15235 [Saccharicrinis sp. FJH62]